MRMTHTVNALIITIVSFLGVVSAAAANEEFSLSGHALNARVLYSGHGGNMQFFLNSLTAVIPGSIGTAPSSIFALYRHALTLLDSSRKTNSISSTFGFSFGHLHFTLATTDDSPIPWDMALEFVQKMIENAQRGLFGVEYQALVYDLAFSVTITVTLKLLFDEPLRLQVKS
ncbi:MAG: hypothetical protein Q9180_009486 [Flavoplaca navasiana]